MTSYHHARTSFARRDLGTDDIEYDRTEINDFIESPCLWEIFYELSSFNDFNSHLTPQPSATNLDSANEPLFRAASAEPLFQTASDINSVRHSLDPSSNHRSISRHQRYFQGWRVGVTACAAMTGAVLVVNAVLTIWASVKFGLSSFIGTIQEGKCDQTKHLGLWLHLAINFLSTLLLSASNYCMQCLSSPTRAEINKAHSEKRWLDIGIPSVKNLSRVSWRRITLWWCLALSSIPLHLLYNSAIFSTLSTQDYSHFTVDADFLTGSSFDFKGVNPYRDHTLSRSLDWLQDNISSLAKLENAACIKAYGNDFVSSYGDLLLVSSTKNANNSLLSWGSPESPEVGVGYHHSYKWICSDHVEYMISYEDTSCDLDKVAVKADEWVVERYPIDYCLSRKNEEHCTLQFSLIIMIVVILSNLLKMICMIVTVWKEKSATLVTLGDAISSFLDDPDPTTAGCCLADKSKFTTKKWQLSTTLTKKYVPQRHRWFRSASVTRWAICNVLCLATLIIASILLRIGLNDGSLRSRSFSHLQKLGFGAVTSESLITSMNSPGPGGLLATVFVANSPQVILSFLYLNYNGLFTCMLMASEWGGFAHQRKYLRVTSPIGKQRSSYRLQLPYIYGILLLIISGTLHWLVSQSIFLARIEVFDVDGVKLTDNSISTCGYSLIAIITVIALGSIVVLGGIVNGFRVYDAGMPLVGSCSAAISAACHPKQQDEDMSVLPVKWGAEKTVEPIGHCSFSSFEVDMPIAGERYGR